MAKLTLSDVAAVLMQERGLSRDAALREAQSMDRTLRDAHRLADQREAAASANAARPLTPAEVHAKIERDIAVRRSMIPAPTAVSRAHAISMRDAIPLADAQLAALAERPRYNSANAAPTPSREQTTSLADKARHLSAEKGIPLAAAQAVVFKARAA